MLGLFAVTGHSNYAKSARLYLQQMESLPESHPRLHAQFMSGNHSIRRSDRYWAGLSADLVIEQTMMRSLKSTGGLTWGRGMHETAQEMWLHTWTECASVRAALCQFTGTERSTPEHVEVGKARMQRDVADFTKVKQYLNMYSPFRFVDNKRLVSLSSGVIASDQDWVNCEQADKIGFDIQEKRDKCNYGDITLKKSEQVKTMAHLTIASSIGDEKVYIDPSTLFHRLVIVDERDDSVRE